MSWMPFVLKSSWAGSSVPVLIKRQVSKNKSAVLMDYLCDCKADLYAITETWLTEDAAAVRAESNLDRYNFLDHPREGRCGGRTGLIFRDSLCVLVC